MSLRLLVDTCAFLKWADGSMPSTAQEIFLSAEHRYISVLTSWEIQLTTELRARMTPDDISTLIRAMGLEVVPLDLAHVKRLAALKKSGSLPHRDPFDYMIIAQALHHSLPVLTCDDRFCHYPGIQVLW